MRYRNLREERLAIHLMAGSMAICHRYVQETRSRPMHDLLIQEDTPETPAKSQKSFYESLTNGWC